MVREDHGLVVAAESGASVSIGGLEAIFRLSGDETSGAYAIVEHVLVPGQLGSPPHTHTHEDEVSIILEGEIGVLIGNDVFTASAGSYVVKPRGVPHAFWNDTTAPARFVEIISPPGFECYFAELAELLSEEGPPDMEGVVRIAERYGLIMHMEQLPELMERFKVRLGP